MTVAAPASFRAAEVEGFPEFYYVTFRDEHGHPLGGEMASIVERATGAVHRVPGSRCLILSAAGRMAVGRAR